MLATRRICGRAAVQGTGHAALAGLAAGAVGAGVGVAVYLVMPIAALSAVGVAVVAACCAVVAFGAVAYVLDRGDLRTVMARLRTRLRAS